MKEKETAMVMEKRKLTQQIKELKAELQKKVLELEERNKEIESFLYTISHDLKSPLVSIQGFCSELARECGDRLDEGGRYYLTRIAANATQMEKHIVHLLELSRVGRMDTTIERVDARNVLKEVVDHMGPCIRQRGIEVLIPTGPFEVAINPMRLKQLFSSLLDNALRYMGAVERPKIEIRFDGASDAWQFIVKDNGIGIAKEHQQKIFNIFERLPDGKVAYPEGTGMGLALVKRIVEVHGGCVWVESECGKGSTFHISIPRLSANNVNHH
jgi:signal transduction histidine kinase